MTWYRDAVLRLLVAGSVLNSVAFFATLPFLSIYLAEISTLSGLAIGAVVGSVALIASLGGFVGGMLSDRFGAVALIRAGVLLNCATGLALAMVHDVGLVIALTGLLGVGRLLTEPSMKKLMSVAADGTDGSVFRIRYVTLCLGAVVGPLLGAVLYAVDSRLIFSVPAVVFAGYFLLLQRNLARLRSVDAHEGDERGRLRDAVNDRRLLRIIAAGFVLFLVFSQFESILPLYVRSVRGPDAVTYFSILLAVNAALGIVMQFPVARLARRVSASRMAFIGCVGFALALLLFRMLPASAVLPFVGVLVWTVGEAVLFPMPDMAIHTFAPNGRKGAYFGLAEVRYLGFFLGPALGGGLLGISATTYFTTMAVVIFGTWLLLGRNHERTPDRPSNPTERDAVAPVAG
ncbi:MFS transporter [Actinocrispum wychmicini]|uniref:Putative MFS family arabinose efflux permease n=1 Tax=Actinocrispum wychmicini TaxID=1213861 RepID=A0A4R2JYL4_9PSEU|nr:MFS transporter [Actinocrispum wychmicini]TCO62349.1 putative MFS family arabinose efflux permease [Actinocrispum wychmicini]